MSDYLVTERLCKTEDGRAVVEGDPEARWLLAIPGQTIPEAEAIALGLITAETASTDDSDDDADTDDDAETKAVEAASNKARGRGRNK
jgi:hypothetical protein